MIGDEIRTKALLFALMLDLDQERSVLVARVIARKIDDMSTGSSRHIARQTQFRNKDPAFDLSVGIDVRNTPDEEIVRLNRDVITLIAQLFKIGAMIYQLL